MGLLKPGQIKDNSQIKKPNDTYTWQDYQHH